MTASANWALLKQNKYVYVSSLCIKIYPLYRFIHVVCPHAYPRWSEGKIFFPIIVFCWTFAFFFCAAPLFGWGSYAFEPLILQCTFNSQNPDKSHKITVVTIGYVIPCVFISVCYARIGCVVYRSVSMRVHPRLCVCVCVCVCVAGEGGRGSHPLCPCLRLLCQYLYVWCTGKFEHASVRVCVRTHTRALV